MTDAIGDEIGSLTRTLVSIPSHEDESDVGDFVEGWLREETNAEVTRDAIGNVIARRGGPSPTLGLVGHHDVVPPADRQLDGGSYLVEERDGRLHGRGTADMKGALAAAMCAFRDADPSCDLAFASFVGEERGGVGARHAIENGFVPNYAIVCEGSTGYSEPGVTDVAVAHKGRRGITIDSTGTSAHASEPDAGINAIYRALDVVDRIRNLDVPTVKVFDHELSGSLIVTTIEGGTAPNVIPDRCRLSVDVRTVPGGTIALDRVSDIEGVEVTVDDDLPPMRCDDEKFARLTLDVARTVQDGGGRSVVKPHATDAGWLAQAGTSCLVCGAAEPGQAHTATESVGLAALERCYGIYRGVAERLSSRST